MNGLLASIVTRSSIPRDIALDRAAEIAYLKGEAERSFAWPRANA